MLNGSHNLPRMKTTLISVTLIHRFLRRSALPFLLVAMVGACANGPHETGVNDPNEAGNRRVHAFNKSLDKAILKPLSSSLGSGGGGVVSRGIGNFASNLALPGVIVNDALQANVQDAFSNTFRFTVNSTIGIGGLFDVATANGLAERPTDFGETLYVWGVGEGAYVELPVLGPSTRRDAVGTVVDFIIDPLNYLLPAKQRHIGTVAKLAARVGDRAHFASTVDSILYESADSYAQARLLYLQSRRAKLYGGVMEEDLEDPYAE
ncbi:MAG: VacJ family lipoprotein [Paracoccaceae bacterium]